MASSPRQPVQFKTADGLTLSGFLYLAGEEGEKRPAIIMTPGMPEAIDPFLSTFATEFQANGYTVLIYDNRNWYSSEGLPRNETDPILQARDYTAALNFLLSLPSTSGINPKKICFWGGSLSAANALSAAAIDNRCASVLALVPTATGEYITEALGPMTRFIMADSMAVTTQGKLSQMFPVGDTLKDVWGGDTGYGRYLEECERLGGKWEGEATTMSMLYLQSQDSGSLCHRIKGKVLMITAEHDVVSPPVVQREMFARCRGVGNEIYEIKGKGHFDVYHGEGAKESMRVMLGFLKKLFP